MREPLRESKYGNEANATSSCTNIRERYTNHILWMAVCRIILTVWDSTRKKICCAGVVLYRSR
jgi:hypothetical protein